MKKRLSRQSTLLNPNGSISVITFHSLEDRICKSAFKQAAELPKFLLICRIIPYEYQPEIKIITRKPIVPSEEEVEENNRARSAKLRIAEKLKEVSKH